MTTLPLPRCPRCHREIETLEIDATAIMRGILADALDALRYPHGRIAPVPLVVKPLLTPHQLKILGMVARGRTNDQIARGLGISELTVKQHMTHIMAALKTNNRTSAVVEAVQRGLLAMPADEETA